jgi:RluA family pseudouridine synthase
MLQFMPARFASVRRGRALATRATESTLPAVPAFPEIVFQDEHLIALNKPSGMLTEGGGDRETDLEQSATQLTGKPVHCCHRLDRLTSGVVLLRKDARFNTELAGLFARHRARKLYWAIVERAWPVGLNRIETRIASVAPGVWANVTAGGKAAVSTFHVLPAPPTAGMSWLGILLKTGRTHQARLHCRHAGCPVIGDTLYGARLAGFFGLHARELRFQHPGTHEVLQLTAPPPPAWPAWARSDSAR